MSFFMPSIAPISGHTTLYVFHAHDRPSVPYTVHRRPAKKIGTGSLVQICVVGTSVSFSTTAQVGRMKLALDSTVVFHVWRCSNPSIQLLAVPRDWVTLGFIQAWRYRKAHQTTPSVFPIMPTANFSPPAIEVSNYEKSDDGHQIATGMDFPSMLSLPSLQSRKCMSSEA
jgi:hypothetical protein